MTKSKVSLAISFATLLCAVVPWPVSPSAITEKLGAVAAAAVVKVLALPICCHVPVGFVTTR